MLSLALMEFEIHLAKGSEDIQAVQILWKEYWTSLGLAPEFQSFTDELRDLPGVYSEPGGQLIIAKDGEKPAGTIALRRLSERSCETKRLYVRPAFRGKGLGRALLNQVIAGARSIGYATMYADSLPSMADAHALYRSCGFKQAGPYSATPTPGAMYFELSLI
ncbi:MAG TPA: GNAT family N-acetyltransferase [Bryobacteraceae bacterium]|nr:GNAT family N-acetyltransferase [Bryobacteraceae bacterium]